jgi:SAM-dependent methyltransferase
MDSNYTGTHLLASTEKTLANYNRWICRQFVSLYKKFDYESVLDFGAGIGSIALLFRRETGVIPLTLEIDPQQQATLLSRGFQPISALHELPTNIDFIYTSNVLEHIPDDVGALKELREHLADRGRIAIFVPVFESIWTALDDKVGHQRRYSKKMLTEHLEKAGFVVEHMRYCDSVGFVLAMLFKYIGNKSGEPSERSLILFDRILWPVSLALDIVASGIFGKNMLAVARKA